MKNNNDFLMLKIINILFVLANIISAIGYCISYILYKKISDQTFSDWGKNSFYFLIPVICCTLISLILIFFNFMFFNKFYKIYKIIIEKNKILHYQIGSMLFALNLFISIGVFLILFKFLQNNDFTFIIPICTSLIFGFIANILSYFSMFKIKLILIAKNRKLEEFDDSTKSDDKKIEEIKTPTSGLNDVIK